MKTKDLLSRMMLLLAVLLAGAGTAWAQDVSYTFSSFTSEETVTLKTDNDNLTITLANGSGSTKPAWNDKSSEARVYAKGSLKVNSASKNIEKIVYTYVINANNKGKSPTIDGVKGSHNNGTWDSTNKTWTGSDKEVTMSTSGDAGNVGFTKIEVWYESTSTKTKVATIADDFNVSTLNINADGTFTAPTVTAADGLTLDEDYWYEWTSSDEDMLTVDKSKGEYIVGSTKGHVDVTFTVKPLDDDSYEEVSKAFTITIVDPNANDGSEAKPYSVAEAREIILHYTSTSATTEKYYVKGIVSSFYADDVMNDGTNYRYYISDDGEKNNELLIYRGKNLNEVAFTSADDVQIGDKVVIYGPFQKYNSTAEMASGNYIVSLDRVVDERVNIATINGITPTMVNVGEDGTFTLDIAFAEGTDATDYEVTLTSSDGDKLYINGVEYLAGDNAGTVTVTVTVEPVDDDTYKTVSKEFTITIVDPNVKGTETNPYTVADVIAMTTAPSDNVYVTGWVVGFMKSGPQISTNSSDFTVSNIALADNPDETDVAKAIAIQFSNNSARASLNLKDCPYNLGVAKYLLQGKVAKAFGKMGLSSTLVASKKVAEQVSITEKGMATYYTDCALDFTDCENIYAYTATLSGDAITFTRVRKVPANTGVLLRNPNGGVAKETVPVVNGQAETVGGNKFVGTLTDKTVDTEGYYILSTGSNGLGFYKVKSEGGSKVAAHRAYLDATGAKSRAFIGFNDDEATGVNAMDNGQWTMDNVYNLQGVRVAQPTKGLYIVNGKKVIFK